jgi:hypothetical protein
MQNAAELAIGRTYEHCVCTAAEEAAAGHDVFTAAEPKVLLSNSVAHVQACVRMSRLAHW